MAQLKPDGMRARRNPAVRMNLLPSEGRRGRVPPWPLVDDVVLQAKHDLGVSRLERARFDLEEAYGTAKEDALEQKVWRLEENVAVLRATLDVQRQLEEKLWKDLWRTPAATQFDTRWLFDLALMVRTGVLAQLGDEHAKSEFRLQMSRYGLDPTSRLRLRWQIAPDEVAAKRATQAAVTGGATTSWERYARLRVPPTPGAAS